MDPGVYFSIPNNVYHAGPGVSKSQLDDISLSYAVYKWRKSAPIDEEKIDALTMGTALHCLLLEPDEFTKRFICAPKFNRRTTAGKEEERDFLESVNLMGKTVLDAESWRKLHLMRDSVFAHDDAKKLLEAEGHAEASMYWNDEETGLLCRTRPDKFLSRVPVILDVKKVADMARFPRHIAEFRYHVQDAFYREGFRQNYGETPSFVFIAVSDTIDCGRYPVRVFMLSQYDVDVGTWLFRQDLNTFARSLAAPNYGGIEEITRPEWDKRNDYL